MPELEVWSVDQEDVIVYDFSLAMLTFCRFLDCKFHDSSYYKAEDSEMAKAKSCSHIFSQVARVISSKLEILVERV